VKTALAISLLSALCLCFSHGWESELYDAARNPLPSLNFDSDKLIQDFSYAGYQRGEQQIPTVAGPVFNAATGYSADPTGSTDSTTAIQNAIDAAATAGGDGLPEKIRLAGRKGDRT
jgi:polygalacturonase